MAMHDVDVAGCRLACSVEGDAAHPVLLLSNALGTTRELWRKQRAALAASFRVIAYDTRGHGGSVLTGDAGTSSDADVTLTLDRLGADALAILDHFGVARAHVVGLSLGGLTAMWLGLHAADRVDRLVLANTAARIASHDIWASRIAQVRSAGLASVAEAAPSRWFTSAFAERQPEVVATFQSMLRSIDPDGYTACAAVLRDADLRDEVARITRPVLVVSGVHDPLTTPEDAAFLCAHIPGARACVLGAAHLSNIEAESAFTAAVAAFLGG